MATTVMTGRSCTLSIDGTDFTDQILSSEIAIETERLTFETLSGKAYKVVDKNFTLNIEFLADWNSSSASLSRFLYLSAQDDQDDEIDFVMTVDTGDSFTGKVLPSFPNAGGAASDGQQITLELQGVGMPTAVFAN